MLATSAATRKSSTGGGIGGNSNGLSNSKKRRFSISRNLSFLTWSPEYVQRLFHPSQMDFRVALSQMYELLTDPKRVYKATVLRKQIKNQWARDDPAFVALMILLTTFCGVLFWLVFSSYTLWELIRIVFGTVFVDFIGLGVLVSTCYWFVTNNFMRIVRRTHNVDQAVEWLYAFDVHCNSYFPLFLVLYVLQLPLCLFLLSDGFLPALFSNLLYAGAFVYYNYLTFLGYESLPFVANPTRLLAPIGLVLICFFFGVLFSFNPTSFMMHMYFNF
eukprot:TRINITY_DN12743_c0_g1_i1.p1 TRINITY_DN12743_c0_g1~~TRINITY_DN12743_c0_g1_i1.p1  ORF type:complete len:274 (-),score=52.96 TRINITY_DN12743_c0_g1_i1:56-877(-)